MYIIPKSHVLKGRSVVLRTPEAWTDQMVRERYQHFHEQHNAGKGITYAVVLEQRIVGNCGFKNIVFDKEIGEFETFCTDPCGGARHRENASAYERIL